MFFDSHIAKGISDEPLFIFDDHLQSFVSPDEKHLRDSTLLKCFGSSSALYIRNRNYHSAKDKTVELFIACFDSVSGPLIRAQLR